MNLLKIKGNWHSRTDKRKRQFTDLNNLLSPKEKKEELLGRLKDHIGKADEDLQKIISRL
jgi:hypothetical protein